MSPSTTLCGHLRLTPNLIGHLPHQGQFGTLVVVGQGVPALVGAEAALGADADPLEGLLAGLPGPLRDEVGGLVDLGLGGLLVLELAQFRADATHDDVLVPGEELERFEPSGPLGVVFQVEGVDVEVLEQPLGDDVVGTLGEVSAPDEVAPAQVDARVEVGGQAGDGVVVQLDVGVQKLVDRPDVVLVLLPTLAEGVGTEIFLVRIRQIMSPGGKKDGKKSSSYMPNQGHRIERFSTRHRTRLVTRPCKPLRRRQSIRHHSNRLRGCTPCLACISCGTTMYMVLCEFCEIVSSEEPRKAQKKKQKLTAGVMTVNLMFPHSSLGTKA